MNTTFEPSDISTQVFTEVKHLLESAERPLVLPIIGGLIVGIGILFNIIVIVVIVLSKDYRKISNWYVLNLAAADTIFLIMLPFELTKSVKGGWPFGRPECVIYFASFYMSYYSGIFFLTVMSFDRYVAILHPVSIKWKRFRSNITCYITTAVVWALAWFAVIPIMMHIKTDPGCEMDFSSNDNYYDVSGIMAEAEEYFENLDDETLYSIDPPDQPPEYKAWLYSNFILAFLVPVATLLTCYSCILWRVLHPRMEARRESCRKDSSSSSSIKRRRSTSSASSARKKHRVTVLVVTLVVVFIICWLPLHSINLYKVIAGRDVHQALEQTCLLMAFSNSMLNPILYTFLGANFRRQLATLGRKLRRRRSSSVITWKSSRRFQKGSQIHSNESATTKETMAHTRIDHECIRLNTLPAQRQTSNDINQ